jgi:hypothetical protein
LVFSTQDKGSGIDYYEVKEESQFLLFRLLPSKWHRAESPYLLRDQSLSSRIYVKAVDRAGNKQFAELLPKRLIHWYEDYSFWFIIVSGLGGIFYLFEKRGLWGKFFSPKT